MWGRANGAVGESPKTKVGLGILRHILRYLRPYRVQVAWALVALTVAALTVLGLGAGLRRLVDDGFAAANPAFLDGALVALLAIIVLLAVAS